MFGHMRLPSDFAQPMAFERFANRPGLFKMPDSRRFAVLKPAAHLFF
jgi:hypothetical protein